MRIGYCAHQEILWEEFTVKEHFQLFSFVQQQHKAEEVMTTRIIRDLNLDSDQTFNTTAKCLSGGTRRRLALALSLIVKPDLVILDNPTLSVDPSHTQHMWTTLQKYRQSKDPHKVPSIILKTHRIDEAIALCDDIGIMNQGNVNLFVNAARVMNTMRHFCKINVTLSFSEPADHFDIWDATQIDIIQRTQEHPRVSHILSRMEDVLGIGLEVRAKSRTKFGITTVSSNSTLVTWRLTLSCVFPQSLLDLKTISSVAQELERSGAIFWRIGSVEAIDVVYGHVI
jgi:ABC-type multidrug transport system ATPase subunit